MYSFRSLLERSSRRRSVRISRTRKLRIEPLEKRLVLVCPPICLDFGDAPDSANGPAEGNPYPTLLEHDGAQHVIGGPRMGASVDAEDNGQPNATATGDDLAGFASVSSDFNTGNNVVITFTANQPGQAGNGITVVVTKSDRGIGFAPSINVAGNTISIDLNSNPSTPTTAQQLVGAINVDPNASALIRAAIAQGNPNTDIATPDINYSPLVLGGVQDEDGVNFPFPLIVAQTINSVGRVTVNVQNAPGGATLNAWMDFNQDGDWADAAEQIFAGQAVSDGDNVLSFVIPAGALAGNTFARFRLSRQVAVLPPTGVAPDGEVEDYQVKLLSQVTLSVTPATIAESGGIATVTATLSSVSSQDVTVNLGFTGTSVGSLDYRPSATEILIAAGSTTGSITLTAQNDNRVEGDEQIVVDITAVTNAIEDGVQQQSVAIDDDDTATLSIAAATTVTEQGGVQNIVVTLTTRDGAGGTATLANSEFLLQVPLAGGNPVAGIADEDTFIINDGQGGGDVVFEFDKDGITLPGSIAIPIANGSTQDVIADAIASAIQNSGLGVTSVHLGGGVVRLTGTTHTLDTSGTPRLIQSGAPGVRLTADVDDLFTGTAVSDTDYEIFGKQRVTFTAGAGNSSTQNVRLTPKDDTLVEGNESVNLVLQNLNTTLDGQASLGTTNGVVTITDADLATVAWQAATTTVGEDVASPNVTAVLTMAVGNTLQNDAMFTVTATNGTAEDADYDSGAFPKTITFPAASGNGATQSATFDPASDTLVEGDETVTLTLLVNSGAATLGALTTHAVTITDADTATVAWQLATTIVGEDAATPNVTAVLTTAAGNTLENPAVFTVTATNGSAEDADYNSGAFPTKITFPAASGNGATQSTTLDPASDALVEGDETVALTLIVDSGVATLGAPTTHTVTITDADTATVAWQLATTIVGEDAATPNVTAVLTTAAGNRLENAAVFTVTATNGSAENADYDSGAFPKTITFPAGSVSGATQSTTFDPASDTLVEGEETVTLTLLVNSGAATLGAPSAHGVTITDADTATVAWQSATTTVGEDAVTPNVTAVLTTAAGNTLENAAVFNVTATNGSAENADYDSGAFPKTITFPAGSVSGATQSTTFDPASDTLVEGDETLTLTLLVNSGVATLGAQTTHTVTIQDADLATVAWQSATTSVGEDDNPAPTITAVLTTAIGNTLENDARFTVTATNGSAENADYDNSVAFPVTLFFSNASSNGATQIIIFDQAQDKLVEGDETVILTLLVNSGAATLGAQTTHVVTITDADTATMAWQSAITAVGEDAATPTITAVLTTAAGNTLENAAVFNVTATNGSAENADYDSGAFPKTITFPAASGNGATQNTTIDPASDTLVEGDETVTLTLLVSSGVGTLGAQTTHAVTITDVDTATVAWQSAATTVGEDAATPNVTAVLITAAGNTLENTAVFNVTATNGSAENADYDSGAFPKTITFASASGNGATQNTILDPASDALVEGDETVTLALAVNSGVATVLGLSTHVVTITDAAPAAAATVAWQSVTTAVGEDAATINVTAVLTMAVGNTLVNPAVFNVFATNGSAENADYDSGAFPKTITFAPGSGNGATQNTTFDPASDTLVEGDETLTLTLAVNSGVATLGAQTTHAVTITDADTVTVAWQSAATTVGEDAATPNVTAVLTTAAGNTLENAAVFNVTATNGSAEDADYDSGAFPKSITFPAASGNGATQNTTFDPASDALVEGDETVTLALLVNSGVATQGAQSTHGVTIADADLASPVWRNPKNQFDVNDNTTTDPFDALLVINELNLNGSHVLPIPGVQPPFLDVNGDGFVSPVDVLAIINDLNATVPAPVPLPCDPSMTDLIVTGSPGNDRISIVPALVGGVNVILNGTTSGPFSPAGRIVVCGRDGDDTITVDANINRSTFLYGGAGNDVLDGGSGNDVLVGGEGNDQLYGGLGRNVMISGTSTNVPPRPTDSKRLLGGIGDNLMIAGFTDFDTLSVALAKILDEWSRLDADYITRVNHLRGTLPGGRNDTIVLNATTVHNNSVRDDLFGCTGQNWYLAHTVGPAPLDTILGQKATELLETI